MTDLPDGPGQGAPADAEVGTGLDWGRILDAAGIVAGLLLAVIVADIWTDGRLISRRLRRNGGEPVERDEP